MDLRILTPRQQTYFAAGIAVLGSVHILVPRILLGTAAYGYRLVLAVDFDPRDQAARRVRIIGLGMISVALLALWPHSTGQSTD